MARCAPSHGQVTQLRTCCFDDRGAPFLIPTKPPQPCFVSSVMPRPVVLRRTGLGIVFSPTFFRQRWLGWPRVWCTTKTATKKVPQWEIRMPVGQIVSLALERGFGFIRPRKGNDVFFHLSVVNGPTESLSVGQEVEYAMDASAKRARAESVTVLGGGGVRNDRQRGSTSPSSQHSARRRG